LPSNKFESPVMLRGFFYAFSPTFAASNSTYLPWQI
jgi:hypothetical protein